MSYLSLRGINKSFGPVSVLKSISLDIERGEFAVFVGPSGCGKSTLLRLIAGLEEVDEGTISIDGRDVTDIEPVNRGIAMVFQNYALYPHMSVDENMRFGLDLAKVGKDIANQRIAHTADLLQIGQLRERKPAALSGGERQRVAIGRAIVREPSILLFDEPLSNLDAALRVQMRVELAKLRRKLGATFIYVTHDQVEAMTLADKIVVMSEGKIAQVGAPMDIYRKPANTFVAGFIGGARMNLIDVTSSSQGTATISTGAQIPTPSGAANPVKSVGIRPEHLTTGGAGTLEIGSGEVSVVEHLGDHTLAYVETPSGRPLCIKLPGDYSISVGSTISLFAAQTSLHFFDSTGDRVR